MRVQINDDKPEITKLARKGFSADALLNGYEVPPWGFRCDDFDEAGTAKCTWGRLSGDSSLTLKRTGNDVFVVTYDQRIVEGC